MALGLGNLEKVLRQLEQYGEGFDVGALQATAAEAAALAELARDIYTPIDTGALRSTYRVVAELREPHLAVAQIVVGGEGSVAPYAVIVHEDPEARHDPPTQYKYLERAARELVPEMGVKIGDGAVSAARSRAGI